MLKYVFSNEFFLPIQALVADNVSINVELDFSIKFNQQIYLC